MAKNQRRGWGGRRKPEPQKAVVEREEDAPQFTRRDSSKNGVCSGAETRKYQSETSSCEGEEQSFQNRRTLTHIKATQDEVKMPGLPTKTRDKMIRFFGTPGGRQFLLAYLQTRQGEKLLSKLSTETKKELLGEFLREEGIKRNHP